MTWFARRPKVRHLRLRTEPGTADDQFLQVPLTEHFDYLDVLSLELSQQDLYALQQADYGVVAGRVVANEGVGVPNCRISIFIPAPAPSATEEPLEAYLRQRYPWQQIGPDDVDESGRRYNLLPAQPAFRGYNGFPYNELGIGATPVTPLGSFPEREGVLTDPVAQAVHERYYRYTTVTNESGDFVLMGVPVGQHTLHLDADLTDLGRWSYSAAMLQQVLGYPESQFEENGKRVKQTTDLNSMSHLITLDNRVTVRPLWGQRDETGSTKGNLLGITRQDFRFPVPLRPHFTLGGSLFSMGRNRWWGDNLHFRLHFGLRNLCVRTSDWIIGGGCSFGINFCAGIDVTVLTIEVGNCDNHPDDTFYFGFGFRIPNIIPFFRFEFRDDYCRLNGGKYDSSPFDLINHGATCECDVDAALQHVPDDGLSAGLLLSSHRPELPVVKLFSLTDEISDEQATRWLSLLDAGQQRITESDWGEFNPATSVKLIPKTGYLALLEQGQFILQPFCNRRPMITGEDGRLVDSPDPSKGVMTEFRGYLHVKGSQELDTPSTADSTGRLALKIPQSFDYGYAYDADGNPHSQQDNPRTNEWIFRHGLFQAGRLYSVAQRVATRRATMSNEEEQENDIGFLSQTFQPDADGSVYKKGWDVQTGLLIYTDRPEGRIYKNGSTYTPENTTPQRDNFPANDTTYLGQESNFSRSPSAPVNTSTSGTTQYVRPGPPHTDFDWNTYPAGLVDQGIHVSEPTTTSMWVQNQTVAIKWALSGGATIPGGRVQIRLVVLGNSSTTSPPYLLFNTDKSQIFSLSSRQTFNAANPVYNWASYLIAKPSTVRVNGFTNVNTANMDFDLTCRIIINSLDDSTVYGVSPSFTMRIV
jgi:hypothetical protein